MSQRPARILILEDRDTDRLYLSTLLGYRGHVVIEASNGEEGLAIAPGQRLDLVISDVLMPRMDGYEFARRLRRTVAGADLPLIFYTATYNEPEARALAEECGVIEVLRKPSEPQAILALVETVLHRGRTRATPIADESFDRQHAQVSNDKLLEKLGDLAASEGRMRALAEIGEGFIEERDPIVLLKRVCEIVREVTQASYAVAGVFSEDLQRITLLLTNGLDDRTTEFLRSAQDIHPDIRSVAADRRPIRRRNPQGSPEHLHLPPWHAPVHSFMVVPLASRSRVYGFFEVGGKEGGGEFSDLDEQIALTLGVQAGIAYENASLISELESQTAALRESHATIDFALSAAGIGICQRDLGNHRITQSKAHAEMFHLSVGDPLDDVYANVHPDDRETARVAIAHAIQSRGEFAFDVRTLDTKGLTFHRQVRGHVATNPQGGAERLLSVVIDMTERKQLEAQLRQAQKMESIGQLSGGVAHDFNNLLTAILGYSRFLLPRLQDDEQRNDVAEILKAGERAAALARQLLMFSRSQPAHVTLFDLNLVIRDLVPMLRRLVGDNIRMTSDLSEVLPPISADRAQIEQVIMNLVVNARDAMESGGDLRIGTENVTDDGHSQVRLRVSDTGVGMTEETKARIFDRFFTTKEAGRGTGLGLSTVFDIVSEALGRVEVTSSVGHGATFTVFLPAAVGKAKLVELTQLSLMPGTESVLLVEDDQAVRHVERTILERAGYTVTAAADVDEALRAGEMGAFDILVTDVMLPGGTGPGLFRQLMAFSPALRVLYVSGYSPESVLDQRQLARPARILTKPFTEEALAQSVREVLDR